jgi:RHS repeat-associated protein
MNSKESANAEGRKNQGTSPPAVSLPKGGGAIKGIGEKFAANPVTGTGSLTVPLPLSPGRGGFTPALALSYDSGAGNGPYGFGWGVGYPSVTRRTDRGLPRYLDRQESDVYILSGAEDLVPILRPDGSRFEEWRDRYRVTRYRTRVEGLFARIERWADADDPADTFWRSISRDNVRTFYGKTAESRIADPADPTRIFNWLVCESYDDKGNAALYEYVAEDGRNVDTGSASESNRAEQGRSANRYLKRVKYGNRAPWLLQPDLTRAEWLFELVMDYGDHEGESPSVDPGTDWPVRPDPFSSYRAGFEVRTYRRCRRLLMFHRFSELGPEPRLVRSLALDFEDFAYPPGSDTRAELDHPGSTRLGSFLRRATVSGYADDSLRASMPPLEFTYTRPVVNDETRTLEDDSGADLPYGVDGVRYQWLDLDSEGLSGVLTAQGGAWMYKANLGSGRLGSQRLLAQIPLAAFEDRVQFLDLAGDGPLDLVQLNRPNAGFFERDGQDGWEPFKPFASLPNVEWGDRNLRFVDLTGDGHADVLLTEDDTICWHPSLAEEGFGPRESFKMPADESLGPRLVFNDTTETVFLADVSGDGLNDLMRIRNGEVCYWPNLGYGRFGPKVTMDDAPVFDAPELFEPERIRLADIDGSGVVDIIYLAGDGVRIYFNRSGNGWGQPHRLSNFPPIDNVARVGVTDLLGNGTACLVWSSPLPNEARAPLHFVDLMGGVKPHLLAVVENNMGARTRVEYAPSTRFYLEDKLAGRPWVTRLPFPVHVVERAATDDDISRNRFVTRYAYHHGYFDGVEREFRGFGMVEQFDTEEFAALNALQPEPAANVDASSHVPPVLTRTWFHTGVHLGRDRVSNFFAGLSDADDAGEYYREPGLNDEEARRLLLEDTPLPDGLTVEEEREACRALKGAMLRQEIYSLDGTGKQQHPYSVTEQNFTVRLLQQKGANPHAVFFSHPHEAITFHYERDPRDPRVAHALTLRVDDFGNVLESAVVGYGRRGRIRVVDAQGNGTEVPNPELGKLDARDRPKQTTTLVSYTENIVTNAVEAADEYRAPLPCETRTYELTGLAPAAGRERFTPDELLDAGVLAAEIPYEQNPSPGVMQKRLVEHVRTLYRSGDLTRALGAGELESLALPFESYKLAFTPGLLAEVYGGKLSDSMLDEGGYVRLENDGRRWIPSGRMFYSPGADDDAADELAQARAHFFLPRRYSDPFGNSGLISFDRYDLLLSETRDALANTTTVGERDDSGNLINSGNDYRVLQPRLVTDPNGNRAALSFDALGMVVGTAVMGKRGETPRRGDLLDGFAPDLPEGVVAAHLADPLADPHSILGRATTRLVYDLFAYQRTKGQPQPAPNVVYTLARETHDADLAAGARTKIQHSFSYSDGFGREIQKKIQAEPGPVPRRDPATGRIVTGADGQPQLTDGEASPRWVGSGWAVFNNKGKPVRQYEPFFTDTHRFEFDVRIGVSPVLFYDPVERVVATLRPDHTWDKVVFDAWRQETWDATDTALIASLDRDAEAGDFFSRLPDAEYLPTWHALRTDPAHAAAFAARYPDPATRDHETKATAKAEIHAATPAVTHFDAQGRPFLTVAHDKFKYGDTPAAAPPVERLYSTRVVFDIEGNQREVEDANDRVVMRYDYDMLGTRIHQASMEAGERWMLNDVTGRPVYTWDSQDRQLRGVYDQLRRSVESRLSEGGEPELMVGQTVYGETLPDPEAANLRAKAVQLFDQAGVVTSDDYDFKGNVLSSSRQLAREYRATLNWLPSAPPVELEDDIFISRTRYDALNRPVEMTTPHTPSMRPTVVRPTYNEANLLERVDANLRGDEVATAFVADIDYDAKGQRTLLVHGNGVRTTYEYDALTFRLKHLRTMRGGEPLQDLSYTYDPVGNLTHIRDDAQQDIYFSNRRVEPSADYTYDAVYRLIEATGREHLGQTGEQTGPPTAPDAFNSFHTRLAHPGNGRAMGTYVERYFYDAVGNFQEMRHLRSDPAQPGWTRTYKYDKPSLLEPGKSSNRLGSTTVETQNALPVPEPYAYDAHGNMTEMPHLSLMLWDYRDQFHATSKQVVNNGGTPETTFYIYDSAGQRTRKVTERQAAPGATPSRKSERIYLGGFEIYREYRNDSDTVTLERETLHVMDGQRRVALVETRTQGEDDSPRQLVRYQFGNHLGSASLELDGAAQIISYEEYYPFGGTSYQAGRSLSEVSLKRYRETGKERDEENGLNYHGARYYAPWLGRWTAPDPKGMDTSTNLYLYALNNPTKFIDPDGASPSGAPSYTQPSRGDIGTYIHQVVLQEMQRRLASIGVPSVYEVETLQGGSKTPGSSHSGSVDLAVLVPDSSQKNQFVAHVYELKPFNPVNYTGYVAEVQHYTKFFPLLVGNYPISNAKVGTVLEPVKRVDDLTPGGGRVFAPIVINGLQGQIIVDVDLAKDRFNQPISGLLVYNIRARSRSRSREEEDEDFVQDDAYAEEEDVDFVGWGAVAANAGLAAGLLAKAFKGVMELEAAEAALATARAAAARAVAARAAAQALAKEALSRAAATGVEAAEGGGILRGLSRIGNRLLTPILVPGSLFKREGEGAI